MKQKELMVKLDLTKIKGNGPQGYWKYLDPPGVYIWISTEFPPPK